MTAHQIKTSDHQKNYCIKHYQSEGYIIYLDNKLFFSFVNNIVTEIFFLIQFLWLLLNWDFLSLEPNIWAKLVIYIEMRFIVFDSMISFYKYKKLYDYLEYYINFLNHIFIISWRFSGCSVIFDLIFYENV